VGGPAVYGYIDYAANAVDEEVTYVAENVHPLRMP